MVYKFKKTYVDGEVKNDLLRQYNNIIGWGIDWVQFRDGEYISQNGAALAEGEYFTNNPDGDKTPELIDVNKLFGIIRGDIE